MDTVSQSLITLVIGGVLGGIIKSILDYRSQVFSHLWEKRFSAYGGIWTIMKLFPLWPRLDGLTYSDLHAMSVEMRDWYFDSGGIIMSESTRTAYGNLQKEINTGILKGKNMNDQLTPGEYDSVQSLSSKTRSEMTKDLLSRKKLF